MKYTKPKMVIYHAQCFDGMTAAWLLVSLWDEGIADYYAAEYNKPFPDTLAEEIIIVDFSYPREVIEEQTKLRKYLIVLDHHKTAMETLAGLPNVVLNNDKSGAGLALDYLAEHASHIIHPDLEPFVAHVQDRDLWQFKMEGTKEFTARMGIEPYTFGAWDNLFREFVSSRLSFFDKGKVLLRHHEINIDKFINSNLIWIKLFGKRYPMLNLPKEYGSDSCAEMLKRFPDSDFALYYYEDSESYVKGPYIGLRSRVGGPIDVSIMAKRFGGGGHREAAAFRAPMDKVRLLEFERDLYKQMGGVV